HVVIPIAALLRVVNRKLPILVRPVQACQKTLLLLVLRKVQKELAHNDAVACKVALKVTDVFETLIPNLVRNKLSREFLTAQKFRMNAHGRGLFVITAIKDADAPAFGQALHTAPEVIVVEFFRGRTFEREDLATLRIY